MGLNLHLEPDEFQIALKWWLGINMSLSSYCPDHQLDHHVVMCKGEGDVVLHHNSLRDVFSQFCHRAHLGGQLEVGCSLGADKRKPHLPLLSLKQELQCTSGSAAMAAGVRKHLVNDPKCSELGWVSIPLAVETYGCWGAEAQCTISRLASRLAIQMQCSKSKAITTIYQRFSLTLIRANARA